MTETHASASAMSERVICVDENDIQVGEAGKMEAHVRGLLHRAFSVFLFDRRGRLLLQRRASGKYHAAGLWANSCCGHPRPGEAVHDAANRRLGEELGVAANLKAAFRFRYCVRMENGLIENELVHMMVGCFSGSFRYDECEVSDITWRQIEDVAARIDDLRYELAPWFQIYLSQCLPTLLSWRDRLLDAGSPS